MGGSTGTGGAGVQGDDVATMIPPEISAEHHRPQVEIPEQCLLCLNPLSDKDPHGHYRIPVRSIDVHIGHVCNDKCAKEFKKREEHLHLSLIHI